MKSHKKRSRVLNRYSIKNNTSLAYQLALPQITIKAK